MRTTIILLFTCVFISLAETGHSQNTKVTLNKNKVALKEVLNEIENQTDYLFIYNNQVNTDKTVSINSDNSTVREVLTHVLKDSDIDFLMEGNHIILSNIEKQLNEKNEDNTETLQQQGKTVTGTIVDANGEPIIGANIIEKGTSNGTITDIDGNFSLNVSDNAVLRISYIGYLEQEIVTTRTAVFNISLIEDTKTLDELVVVGYGMQKKVNLTGSVSSVRGEDISKRIVAQTSAALQGLVPGLTMTQQSGQPGYDGGNLYIRGIGSINAATQPLVLVDNVQISINNMTLIQLNQLVS